MGMKTSRIIIVHFFQPQGKEKFIKQKTKNANHYERLRKYITELNNF